MARSRFAAVAAVAALAGSLTACSGSSSKPGAAAPAPSTPTTSVSTAGSVSSPPASPATSTSAPSAALTADQLESMSATVGAVYFQGVTDSPHFAQAKPDTAELAADFTSADVMNQVWGTGADRPLACGTAKYNGVAIGTPTLAGDIVKVPVQLYFGTQAGTRAITVALDPASGKVKGVACGGQADASAFPGIAPIAGYYGAMASGDAKVLNAKPGPFFTAAFGAWAPAGANFDKYNCTQYVPDRWVVALTGASGSASTWDFADDRLRTTAEPGSQGGYLGFRSTLAVDLSAKLISRVSCGDAKAPKIPVASVVANRTPDAVGTYVSDVLSYYSLSADQQGFGVDAKSVVQAYFVSDAAFEAAWSQTGSVPLLCAKKVPGEVQLTGSPAISGDTATLNMVTWPMWHPDAPGQELSKFTVKLDLATMKMSGITCAK